MIWTELSNGVRVGFLNNEHSIHSIRCIKNRNDIVDVRGLVYRIIPHYDPYYQEIGIHYLALETQEILKLKRE